MCGCESTGRLLASCRAAMRDSRYQCLISPDSAPAPVYLYNVCQHGPAPSPVHVPTPAPTGAPAPVYLYNVRLWVPPGMSALSPGAV